MTTATGQPEPLSWERYQRPALIAGVVGLLVFGPGYFLAGQQWEPLLRSYLVGYCFWLGVALGSLALLMLQHMTGGGWGFVLRRLLEGGTRTLPLLAVLFLPLAVGVGELYLWAKPDHVQGDAVLEAKAGYLNPPFFLVRAAVYFLVWLVMMALLNRWSREHDRSADPQPPRRFRLLSGPGLGIYGLTITFASIDWVMSLEPHWYSTVFGVLFGASQVLSALAFGIAAAILLSAWPPLSEALTPGLRRDLGNLLLAFVMIWAYLSLSQYLLIYAGNLPEETPYYLKRGEGGWQVVAVGLVLLHFALPFLMLLSPDVKENPRSLAAVAGLVLVMRFVDLLWQIAPAPVEPGEGQFHVLDLLLSVAAFVGVGGLWLAFFLWQLRQLPLLPAHAPAASEGHHG